jgi:hypothetical protein
MKRRSAVKTIALSTLSSAFTFPVQAFSGLKEIISEDQHTYKSNWENWPDMKWVGPEYWGNRLQDWEIVNGKAQCVISGPNRTLHILTHQLGEKLVSFNESVKISWLNKELIGAENAFVGFRLGAKGKFADYRSSAVFGEGLDVGINGQGKLIGNDLESKESLDLNQEVELALMASYQMGKYTFSLSAKPKKGKSVKLEITNIEPQVLEGNISLVAHASKDLADESSPLVAFSDWSFEGEKLTFNSKQFFGPICFAQYTLHQGTLKLTAQLAPIEKIADSKVFLEIKSGAGWKKVGEGTIQPMARTAQFRVENWEKGKTAYRVGVSIPLKTGVEDFYYYGEIAKEPESLENLKAAVFSCNADYGFPDEEVSIHVAKHNPEIAFFLGDQFYEGTGGFGIQTGPFEKSSLDYLRKWYMFGWSYRNIFRTIPTAFIPDDHDVYHGNVWGEGGKVAPTDKGWGYIAQDQGGYKMPGEWVNMVQETQTSHLPDPFDATAIKQNIGVYYTEWVYGGVSFAVLEDRKFKSAPKNVLPAEAKVQNGFIQNPDFDIKKQYDIDATLLGDRQLKFLESWVENWTPDTQMKAVLSQTNFCTVATLPQGSLIDEIVPRLPIPEKGEYPSGDAPTIDMDSNGWPQKGRDKAVRIIRKSHALHIAGDQHLASTVQYGVDEYRDSGFAFAGPALNNLWPRRWWPTVDAGHRSIPGKPKYTGDFEDGFGNKMTVYAIGNPYKTGLEPARIYDRATGYGIITFDKENQKMKIECWPRYVDPILDPNGQYSDWPVEVAVEDNYGKKAMGHLAEIAVVPNAKFPLLSVINERTGELEYKRRIPARGYKPKVFTDDSFTIIIEDHDSGLLVEKKGMKISTGSETVEVK